MKKILIVEDDSKINEMISVDFSKAGYSCVSAFSGTEAKLLLKNQSFDLIILDLMLPGMKGETFLGEVRQVSKIPVIVLSAKDNLQYKELCLDVEKKQLFVSGHPITLTAREYRIMELFLKYPQKVFSKNELCQYAWEDYYMGEDKTVNVHISNIRRKIKKISDDEYIETVWGLGFRLI